MASRVDVLVEVDGDLDTDVAVAALERAVSAAVACGLAPADKPIEFGLQPISEVNLLLTSDTRIHELNRRYRGIDKATDVLSFSQLEGESNFVAAPSGSLLLGDIVISLETARRQALEQGHSVEAELRHLAVHGALHLLGYDHETDEDEARMNAFAAEALAQPVT